jgi:hypothetical protein
MNTIYIGVDFHARQQTICYLTTETGELVLFLIAQLAELGGRMIERTNVTLSEKSFVSRSTSFSLRLSSDFPSLISLNPGPRGPWFLFRSPKPCVLSVEYLSRLDSYLDHHLVAF